MPTEVVQEQVFADPSETLVACPPFFCEKGCTDEAIEKWSNACQQLSATWGDTNESQDIHDDILKVSLLVNVCERFFCLTRHTVGRQVYRLMSDCTQRSNDLRH